MATIQEYINKDKKIVKPTSSAHTILEKSVEPIFDNIKQQLLDQNYFQEYLAKKENRELLSLFTFAFHSKKMVTQNDNVLFSNESFQSLKKYINHKSFKKIILKLILQNTPKSELLNDFVKEKFADIVNYFRLFEDDPESYYLVDHTLYHSYCSLKNTLNIKDEDELQIVEYVKFKNQLKDF